MSETPPKNDPGAAASGDAVGQAAEAPPAVKIEDLLDFAFLEVLATQHRPINLRCGLSCS